MKQDKLTRQVTLNGISPIMFDKYAGDNKTTLEVGQKMYFDKDGKSLVVPSMNIVSFLTATNTPSAPKVLLPSKEYKAVAQAALSYTAVSPFIIPLMRDGEQIVFHGFADDVDNEGGIEVHRCVARLAKGIPNPKIRPVVRLPWSISFSLTLYKNNALAEPMLRKLFEQGGIACGLGTYRGVFGKFQVTQWE